MAAGSGNRRKKVQVSVTCYGVPLDQDERDTLALPPKFTIYLRYPRRTKGSSETYATAK